jgi:hypothetical protein
MKQRTTIETPVAPTKRVVARAGGGPTGVGAMTPAAVIAPDTATPARFGHRLGDFTIYPENTTPDSSQQRMSMGGGLLDGPPSGLGRRAGGTRPLGLAAGTIGDAVVQRTVVDTGSGAFESTFVHDMDGERIERFGIDLRFTPGPAVQAEKIGLVQIVKTHANGQPVNYSPTTTKNQTPTGFAVDRAAPSNNPVYGAANLAPGQALADTGPGGPLPGAEGGGGGHHRYGLGRRIGDEVTPAWMHDAPNYPGLRNGGMEFETTALALVSNTQQDQYYGSVVWGYTVDAQGTIQAQDIVLGSNGALSPNFRDAATRWNASRPLGVVRTRNPTQLTNPYNGTVSQLPANEPVKIDLAQLGMDFAGIGTYDMANGVSRTMAYRVSNEAEWGWAPTNDLNDTGAGQAPNVPLPVG